MRKHLTAKAIEALKPAPFGKRYDVQAHADLPWVANGNGRLEQSAGDNGRWPLAVRGGKNLSDEINVVPKVEIIGSISAELRLLMTESASVVTVLASSHRTR